MPPFEGSRCQEELSWMSCMNGPPVWIFPNATRRSACGSPVRAPGRTLVGVHMGCDYGADSLAPGVPRTRALHHCGDGSDRRLLEAVLLPVRRDVAADAGQRQLNHEHPGTQRMFPTRPGCPNSARTGCRGFCSSSRNRSVTCGTSPVPRQSLPLRAGRSSGWRSSGKAPGSNSRPWSRT